MIGSAALHKAIVAAWSAADLDSQFNSDWSSDSQARYPVLNDMEATPGQDFPYCVYEIEPGTITDRMSGSLYSDVHWAIRDVPLHFRIHVAIDSDGETAKERAADLAEEVMKVFGGHPTNAADTLTLDSGGHLITQYEVDYPERTGDEEFVWNIDYLVRLDVPIAV